MKVELKSYVNACNGISLQIVPETPIEHELLRVFWKHGKLETGHPCQAVIGGLGFYVTFKPADQKTPAEDGAS